MHNFEYGRTRRIDVFRTNRAAVSAAHNLAAAEAAEYPLPEWMDVEHDEL